MDYLINLVYQLPVPLPNSVKLALVLMILILVALLIAYVQLKPIYIRYIINKKLNGLHKSSQYSAELLSHVEQYYTPPLGQPIGGSSDASGDLHSMVEDLISSTEAPQYLMVLGEDGSGKSSFAIRFFADFLQESNGKFSAELLCLADLESSEHIAEIKKPEKTVLILDGLNKDPLAQENLLNRIHELIELTQPFKQVIVLCDPKLFQQPSSDGNSKSRLYDAAQLVKSRFVMLQILPFTKDQIFHYLQLRYGHDEGSRLYKAEQIVRTIPALFTKPMMLSYIDLLVQRDSNIEYTFQIFEEFVTTWLEEAQKENPQLSTKEQFTNHILLAVDIYSNKDQRGDAHISKGEIDKLSQKYGRQLFETCCCDNGLIIRGGTDKFRFAHLQIMEYLVAKAILLGIFPPQHLVLSQNIVTFLNEMFKLSNPFKSTTAVSGLLKYLWLSGFNLNTVDLTGAHFSGDDLSALEFAQINLSGSHFDNVRFSNSTFTGTLLRNVVFTGCNFMQCAFTGVDCGNATIRQTKFSDSAFTQTNLCETIFQNTTFDECKIADSGFVQSQADGIIISGGVLKKVDFGNSTFKKAQFIESQFTQCNFNESYMSGINVKGSVIHGSSMSGCDLQQSILSQADLRYSTFSLSNFRGSDLSESNLSGSDFNNSVLTHCNFKKADLSGTDLSKSDFSDSDMSRVILKRVDLRGATMERIDFSNATLDGVSFNGVNLSHGNFSGATLTGTDLRETDLRMANFTNSALSGADLRVADLSDSNLVFTQLVSLRSFDFAKLGVTLYKQIRVDWPEHLQRPMGVRHD